MALRWQNHTEPISASIATCGPGRRALRRCRQTPSWSTCRWEKRLSPLEAGKCASTAPRWAGRKGVGPAGRRRWQEWERRQRVCWQPFSCAWRPWQVAPAVGTREGEIKRYRIRVKRAKEAAAAAAEDYGGVFLFLNIKILKSKGPCKIVDADLHQVVHTAKLSYRSAHGHVSAAASTATGGGSRRCRCGPSFLLLRRAQLARRGHRTTVTGVRVHFLHKNDGKRA